jgi:hypothetical protein
MKKLISAMSILIGLGLANAQQVQPSKSATPPVKVVKVEQHKKDAPTKAKVEKKAKTVSVNSEKSGVKLKKDGTPDKRFKENKK